MTEGKSSLFSRLAGEKKKDEVVRGASPQNRWQYFWDVLKGNTGKICLINLLILLFFVPTVAMLFMRYYIQTSLGVVGPYGSFLGIGYPAYPDLTGIWEMGMYTINVTFFGGVLLSSFIAAVGLAGGAHAIRNLLLTGGTSSVSDFWKGIKSNYAAALEAAVFFSVFLFFAAFMNSLADYFIAIGNGNAVFLNIMRVVAIALAVFAGLLSLWMISLGATYRQSPWELLRNSFVMTVGMIPHTILFAAAAVLPVLLFLTGAGLWLTIAIVFYLLIGFAYALLSWMSFTQWAFEKFVDPFAQGKKAEKVRASAPEEKKAKESGKEESEEQTLREYKLAQIAEGRSELMGRPMKPIDDELEVCGLAENFSRADLEKLRESKDAIVASQKAYEDEHKNEAVYAEYNKQFADREKALQPERNKNGKVKKMKAPKLLNDR